MKISLLSAESSASQTVDPRLSARRSVDARAARLISEYLRVWGFRDPETIATLAKTFVLKVREAGANDGGEPSRSSFYLAVMRQVKLAMSDRIDGLSQMIADTGGDAESRRGLVAMEMRNLTDEYPVEVIQGELSEGTIERVAVLAQRVVPPTCLKHMPEQPLHSVFQRGREGRTAVWRRLCAALMPRLQENE
jgi:hypothetical protein